MKKVQKISSIQKVIKVGDSAGVTIPARDLRQSGISVGDDVKIVVRPIEESKDSQLDHEYHTFVSQYGETLKNLADR